jgi:hypothetical protein
MANVEPGKSCKSPYLRNYKQMHSSNTTNKKETLGSPFMVDYIFSAKPVVFLMENKHCSK